MGYMQFSVALGVAALVAAAAWLASVRSAPSDNALYFSDFGCKRTTLSKLHNRACNAAFAWIDDFETVDPANPAGAFLEDRTQFFVRKRVICTRIFARNGQYVDVFFNLVNHQWVREKIYYKGERVR